MVIFRLIGLILIVAALMLLGADVVGWLEAGGDPAYRSFADVWALCDADMAEAVKEWVETTFPDPVSTITDLPSWGVLGVLGVVFSLIGRIGQ